MDQTLSFAGISETTMNLYNKIVEMKEKCKDEKALEMAMDLSGFSKLLESKKIKDVEEKLNTLIETKLEVLKAEAETEVEVETNIEGVTIRKHVSDFDSGDDVTAALTHNNTEQITHEEAMKQRRKALEAAIEAREEDDILVLEMDENHIDIDKSCLSEYETPTKIARHINKNYKCKKAKIGASMINFILEKLDYVRLKQRKDGSGNVVEPIWDLMPYDACISNKSSLKYKPQFIINALLNNDYIESYDDEVKDG